MVEEFLSTTSPPYEHSDIYFQLSLWNNYHLFLIAPLVITRLLLDEIIEV